MGRGFLAIWSDVAASRETDYLHWLTREHAAERVGVEGFLAARVFRALDPGLRRYFILYELEGPEVLAGPGYLARLNAPTPWSRRIMPILGNFARAGGRQTAAKGTGQGGVVAAVPLRDAPPSDGQGLVDRLANTDRIAAARLFETDISRTTIQTREKSLRAGDGSFAGLLLIEGLDQAAVRAAADALATALPAADPPRAAPLYGLVFALDRRQLR